MRHEGNLSGAPVCSISSTVKLPFGKSGCPFQPSARVITAPRRGKTICPSASSSSRSSWSASSPPIVGLGKAHQARIQHLRHVLAHNDDTESGRFAVQFQQIRADIVQVVQHIAQLLDVAGRDFIELGNFPRLSESSSAGSSNAVEAFAAVTANASRSRFLSAQESLGFATFMCAPYSTSSAKSTAQFSIGSCSLAASMASCIS